MANAQEFRVKGSPADFHCITLDFGDGKKSITKTSGVTKFDFNDNVDRGEVRAIGRYMDGLTTGEYKADYSLEWTAQGWKDVYKKLTDLGNGIYGFKGNITLSYTEKDGKPTTVVITGAMFKNRKRSGSQGTDGLTVATDGDVEGKIYENGIGPFGERL